MTDFRQQTDALRHNPGITKQDAHTLGAQLIAMTFTPAQLQLAMEWDHDVAMYGLPDTRALQEMAQSTFYSRRQWIAAWVSSRTYRDAAFRNEIPDLSTWLRWARRLVVGQPLAVAAWGADVAERWRSDLTAFSTSPVMTQLIAALNNAAYSLSAYWQAIDPSICHHNPACFCRPAPFPAARDYRRRTKHRRRRQR